MKCLVKAALSTAFQRPLLSTLLSNVRSSRLILVRKVYPYGTIAALMSTNGEARSPVSRRRVPSWAAALFDELSRDAPDVVTRDEIEDLLRATSTGRDVESAVRELRRLGWLVPLPVRGVWAFRPAGHEGSADPYLALRGWLAVEPGSGMRLAGANAAWHLGYLDRQPPRPVSIWLPPESRLPDGLRRVVAVDRIRWHGDAVEVIAPSRRFLVRRKLDLVRWAAGLPAFGPEALLVQLADAASVARSLG